jgi:hypothetical protein
VVEDDFLHLLVHLFLFAKDDIALTLDGLGVELRVLQNVGKDIDGSGDVVVERLGVIDGVFALRPLVYVLQHILFLVLHTDV